MVLRNDNTFLVYNVFGTGDSVGIYSYVRDGEKTGRIHFDLIGVQNGSGYVSSLDYKTAKTGNYLLWNQHTTGTQQGNFKAYDGVAPSTFARKVVRLDAVSGNLLFGGGGTYRLVTTSPTNYVVHNSAGVLMHSGTYSYARTNLSSGVFRFNDSVHSNGFLLFTFESGTNGISLVRRSTTNHLYQAGNFVVNDLREPTFTTNPTSLSVAVGSSATFSVAAVGTGPISLQWYKDNVLIGGATNNTITIPSVQLWDAGIYRVMASSIGGTNFSAGATLHPVCQYSLGTNSVFISSAGGPATVGILASGTCGWSASTTNQWITITSATAGQGNSALTFSVAANTNQFPRTGYIQVANRTLAVAQGGRMAPLSIAGKTFHLRFNENVTSDWEPLQTDGMFVSDTGSNSVGNLVVLASASTTSVLYSYSTSSLSNALVQFGDASIALSYSNAVSGSFVLNHGTNNSHGRFIMSASAPDSNGDGRGDIFWQRNDNVMAAWYMEGTNFLKSEFLRGGMSAGIW
ncbi:MAG: immunoglobulin domain-containing protein, partial [Limisphaerales bacterium]